MTIVASNDKIIVQRSIRWKLMTIITVLIISLVAVLTGVQISSQKNILEDDLSKRILLLRENLITRGKAFISNLTRQVENDIAGLDFSSAAETIKTAVHENREIKYAVLISSSGVVLVHTLISDPAGNKVTERDTAALNHKDINVTQYKENNGAVVEIVNPVQIGTKIWGVLRLVYTLEILDREIESSRNQIREKTKRMIFSSVLTSLGFMAICVVIVFILSAKISKPLIHLTSAARKLSDGDFSACSETRIRSKDEVGLLTATFIEMSRNLENSYKKLEEYNKTLEQKVRERTAELHKSLSEVEEANRRIMSSIRYAKMIQESFLPDMDEVKRHLPYSFFIWMPRDIVGGDIFFTDFSKDGFIIALIDCTGHGVPGALMTMIVSSALRRIITDEGCRNPANILKRLNFIVKTSLKQDTDHALSNDGLDAGICFAGFQGAGNNDLQLTFAGAKTDLIYVHNKEADVIKGDRQSLGYKRSDLDFQYQNHTVIAGKAMSFYMTTDGFTDQLGGEKGFSFGSGRLKNLLKQNGELHFDDQKKVLLNAFYEYRNGYEILDDVTVVGFAFDSSPVLRSQLTNFN